MRLELILSAVFLSGLSGLRGCGDSSRAPRRLKQPELGHRSAPLLTVDGLQFKDLDRNGTLDPYEDWRLPAAQRAADLVQRMSLEEQAGLMVHGTLPTEGSLGTLGVGQEYDLVRVRQLIVDRHVNTFITRLTAPAAAFARQSNAVQALAEQARWGIPATLSTDPRHHFQMVVGANTLDEAFSHWPEALGFGAANDEALTRQFGDAVRQEYTALGIRESLGPQADLVTDPRWARANGTFGEDPEIARRMVFAYVAGIQGGSSGLTPASVIAVVKHWAGYGATKNGWDSHNYYGRFASFGSGQAGGETFQQHLIPFTGAFDAHVAAVMPTYSILEGLTLDGAPVEQVGAGFNRQLLTGLLRGKYGFQGVILSDWAITNACNLACQKGVPAGGTPGPGEIGMSWGVDELSVMQRFAKSINAGVDQVGGTDQSEMVVQAVRSGLVPEARVREAAARVLVQKFAIGIFEQPYVDEARASTVAGNATFVRQGMEAQKRAVVLLQNGSRGPAARPLLPIRAGTKVFLYGVAADAATQAGLTVVTDPAEADVAIVRGPAPYESEHRGYFFGSRQHEGRLGFNEHDAAYRELLRLSATLPTVFVTTLERPLILTNVLAHSTALLGDFGIQDAPLLELLTGKASPTAHLPFELPRSAEAVREQRSDVPHDSRNPLFGIGFGLQYPR